MSRNQLKKDINQLNSRVDKMTPNNDKIAEIIRSYIINHNPEIIEVLKEMSGLLVELAKNGEKYQPEGESMDAIEIMKHNPKIPQHQRYQELETRYSELISESCDNFTNKDLSAIDNLIKNNP